MTSTSQGSCWDFQLLGPQLWEDALVSVDDKRRPGGGGSEGRLQGHWEEAGAGGCRVKVGGTRAPEGRKEKSREYSHYPPRAIPLWPISCWRP